MTDPVLAADGYTYEKVALQMWMQSSIESPVTGYQLSDRRFMCNCVIKSILLGVKDEMINAYDIIRLTYAWQRACQSRM